MSEPPAKRPREAEAEHHVVPVTLISGFLGAGKTSLLKHLLENKAGLLIGVIVNDVAAVNIDKALVSSKAAGEGGFSKQEDLIELANGCACCSLGEEFLQSIGTMMRSAERRNMQWDHIVVESSGVAEPREIRDNFKNAQLTMPEDLHGTRLDTLVTVVDASTFLAEFEKRNRIKERQDLGADGYSEDNTRQVVDLMCEQVECSDVVLLNKLDLAPEAELALLKETIGSLNPHAKLLDSTRGAVEPTSILGAAKGQGVSKLDSDGEMRRIVTHLHEHGHHDHGHAAATGPAPSHGHAEHGHAEHGHDAATCTDKSHDHAHAGGGGGGGGEVLVHGHHEQHGHHDHGHASGGHKQSREALRFGITSFCYSRRRPFHPHRLMAVIRQLPVRREALALSEALATKAPGATAAADGGGAGADAAAAPAAVAEGAEERSPMQALIRSKGFVWLSNSHSQIFYWQLAGKHFELTQYATWWAVVGEEDWPEDAEEQADLKKDFAGEFGDRRQEMVFIGVAMDVKKITALFDECLLTDAELDVYRQHWADGGAAA
ncbi:hypothetical protein EMIHUDRAFT_430429 [Emiliania huxleyi CCMP1516]|uniref:CobW C-terminal domain-containing protein n=2 Tax=Emiliania huxleyi TaxID=2903 RepID=A0A0D3JIK3_EMIH1|nr:hypothetical protein EMIHUDRAFT_430429 [Emiliania huxleyi CCMP1516]EOD23338.1 hypothetical protein EMIHUDRAFT_430429 [Emiliania huxleyi CCMP1516]|mmetsp:Transcript_20687/g.66596  ORF Transcript_20687/g.66596 Transcript_20687/m.66596 type:complete len:547 (+) Transcript_20687:107-1747(+)|eukprot:XP_005775767.1 hypothetical protein EMIHUDRAFT_430429 [Emiliania huxleyi CCMP1516]